MPNLIHKTNVLLLTTSLLSACAQLPRSVIPGDTGAQVDTAKPPLRDDGQSIAPKTFAAEGAAVGPAKGSLWQRIGKKFTFSYPDNPRIEEHRDYLSHNPRHLYTLSERARPFLHYIVEATEQRGLPLELALIPMIESAFEPSAVSPMQAAGLWQITPATGRQLGLTLDYWYDGRHDIQASTQAALDYLQYLHDFFKGDWLLALAAYNAGAGTVQRAIEANREAGKATDYWNLKLPKDTLIYVPRILALSQIVANPHTHGLKLQEIRDEPYLYRVEIGPQIDLSMAAAMAGIPKAELDYFNPCFKRGVTPPHNYHSLLLPREKALILREKLANLQKWARAEYYYIVRQGDSLAGIAQRHGISHQKLARWNGLPPDTDVRPGQRLILQPIFQS